MKIIVLFIISLSMFSCHKQDNVSLFCAQIPFGKNIIYLKIIDNNYIIFEDETIESLPDIIREVLIQMGTIQDDYMLDIVSGEKYFFERFDNSFRFLNGRYKGLIFDQLTTNYEYNKEFAIADRRLLLSRKIAVKNYLSKMKDFKTNNTIRHEIKNENVFSNNAGNLKIILSGDSHYSYYRYDYLIDYGKYKIMDSLLVLSPEQPISFIVEEEKFMEIREASNFQHKAFLINDTLFLGTLPYGLSQKYLTRRESFRNKSRPLTTPCKRCELLLNCIFNLIC